MGIASFPAPGFTSQNQGVSEPVLLSEGFRGESFLTFTSIVGGVQFNATIRLRSLCPCWLLALVFTFDRPFAFPWCITPFHLQSQQWWVESWSFKSLITLSSPSFLFSIWKERFSTFKSLYDSIGFTQVIQNNLPVLGPTHLITYAFGGGQER